MAAACSGHLARFFVEGLEIEQKPLLKMMYYTSSWLDERRLCVETSFVGDSSRLQEARVFVLKSEM